jgi:Bacterial TSP3 repeat
MRFPTPAQSSVLLALLSLPALVQADTKVGLQFLSSRQAAGLGPAENAGSARTSQVNWNYSDNSVNGTTANVASPSLGVLVNDTGTATGIAVTWASANTWNTNNGITTPHSKLFNGYIDNSGTVAAKVDFTGIPYASYSVVVYFGSDGNGRTGKMNSTTAGISYSYATSSAFGRGVTPADYKLTTETTAGNPSANYCIFTNQTSPAFSLNIIRGSNNSGFHAIQIVEGGDTDNDGMPDSYETANGLNPLVNDRALDLDSDGSQNFAEFTNGTKPNDSDTDDDNLLDGAENKTGIYVSITNAGTDPLKSDTDGDGINDGAEPATGPGDIYVTNPVKRDTDGDGYTDSYEITKLTNPTVAGSNPSLVIAGNLGINFTGGYNGASNLVTGTAGAGSFAQSNWNNKNGNTGAYTSLINGTGDALDATASWNCGNTWSVIAPLGITPADEDAALMNGYLDTSDVSTTTVTVENIPYRRYDVVIYKDGDSGDGSRAGNYTVNGVTRTEIRDASNWPILGGGGVYTEAIGSSTSGNYLVFRNVSGGTLTVSATPTTPTLLRAPLNAIQIFGTLDGDGDGMPDQWETDNGLNPNSAADGPLDADTDGLTNAQEYLKGTLPNTADTDADGLLDGVETGTGTFVSATNTGTDPLSPDSDGDGLKDGPEVFTHLSNPLLRDTDSDGYRDGYEVSLGTNPNNAGSPALNSARTVGIHFNSNAARDLTPAEAAGFMLTRQSNWNNADATLNGSTANVTSPAAGSLRDNAGAASPITLTWTASAAYQTTNGTADGDSKLISGYLDNTGSGNTVSLANIPYSRYDVIVYFGSDGNNRTGSVLSPTASVEYFYNTAANAGATGFAKDAYIETTSITAGVNPRANFCRFTGQSSPTFDVQINRGSNNSGIFAIQIVDRALPRIPVTSVVRTAGGVVSVVWQSIPAATYLVQRSEDLTTWTDLAPTHPSAGASTSYTDNTIPANTPKIFYRIWQN